MTRFKKYFGMFYGCMIDWNFNFITVKFHNPGSIIVTFYVSRHYIFMKKRRYVSQIFRIFMVRLAYWLWLFERTVSCNSCNPPFSKHTQFNLVFEQQYFCRIFVEYTKMFLFLSKMGLGKLFLSCKDGIYSYGRK